MNDMFAKFHGHIVGSDPSMVWNRPLDDFNMKRVDVLLLGAIELSKEISLVVNILLNDFLCCFMQ